MPHELGAFEFESRVAAVSRDEEGRTFQGWVQPESEGAPCKLTLALHPSVSAADVGGSARVKTWLSGRGGQGEGGGEWRDAKAAAEEGFVLHEGDGCGGGRRLSFAVDL